MHRAAVGYQLPVHSALAHFVLEGGDFLRRNIWIISSVQCQYFGFDVPGVTWRGAAQTSVKADHAGNLGSASGQFQNGRAAETIADRSDALRISEVMPSQHFKSSARSRSQESAVILVFACFRCRGLWSLRPNAFAIYVRGKDIISELSEHLGAFLFVIAQPFPLVDDENCGPLTMDCVVIDC